MARYRNARTGAIRESTQTLGYPYLPVDDDDPAETGPEGRTVKAAARGRKAAARLRERRGEDSGA